MSQTTSLDSTNTSFMYYVMMLYVRIFGKYNSTIFRTSHAHTNHICDFATPTTNYFYIKHYYYI
ncbi:hypothetical protein H072_10695 [Dactylellina haptotyla CBS 200.50]|uniref:Uncharacterized protein n=1 Tax=Dactylellina haptotyla (strain CBS 200.50) TaxID=1284197 RepID=S8BKU4_DACHA|nr:hypothetical protein H072_10695 [Dactylellina haptotyla CBS 200.50]